MLTKRKEDNGGEQVLTVESGVHASNIDQKTNHGHVLGGFAITEQFVAQDFAGLGASGHCIDVEVGEVLLGLVGFPAVGEDGRLVIEDGF